jgi:hypothetical protein
MVAWIEVESLRMAPGLPHGHGHALLAVPTAASLLAHPAWAIFVLEVCFSI